VALAASVLTGLLLAVPMLWHNLGGNLALALSVESRGGTTTRSAHRLRHALIVAQFALAFTLLAGAGLLGLSFSRVLEVNPGFRPENVLTGLVPLPWGHYKDEKLRFAVVQRLDQELRAIPGVTAVGITTALPFGGSLDDNAISIDGQPPAPGESLRTHYTSGIAGDFFQALGIPLREGRYLTDDDSVHALRVCVVDEDVVRRYWPGKSALGRRIFNGVPDKPEEAYTSRPTSPTSGRPGRSISRIFTTAARTSRRSYERCRGRRPPARRCAPPSCGWIPSCRSRT
jgi:hypothetical protein